MDRSRRLMLILGYVGCGKSSWAIERINAIHKAKPEEKKLILVKSNPKPLENVHTLRSESELLQFCNGGSGICKFYPHWDESRYKEENALGLLASQWKNNIPVFNNGVFFIDDGTGWMTANLKREATDWITNFKNYGVDLFICFHDMNAVPPYIRRNATDVCLFKTGADMDTRYANYAEKYEKYFKKLYDAWKKVEAAPEIPGYIQPHIVFATGVGRRNF